MIFMKTNKIPSSLSVEEVYEIINKKYDGVKKVGKNALMLNYSNTKININKGSDGYVVKAGVPFSLLVLIGVIAGIMAVATQSLGLIPQFVITTLVVAIIILLVDSLYNMKKKNLLQEFCDSLDIENSKHS